MQDLLLINKDYSRSSLILERSDLLLLLDLFTTISLPHAYLYTMVLELGSLISSRNYKYQ